MKKLAIAISMILIASLLFPLSSCKKEESNRNPVISSVTVTPASTETNSMVTVTVDASDPDGDALSYTYTVSGGAIAPNGASAMWTAPGQAGAFSVSVTVSDGEGGTASNNGTLTVVAPPTQITGSASFSAGTSGDLSNAKVSIYTSLDNWYANQPIEFGSVTGSGASVTFTLANINPGNYYLDVWKDNDNDAGWSVGDFIGWYGSGGLGSPSLTEIQITEGQTVNVNLSMFIIEGSPVVTNITGTATIADGGAGDLVNSVAYLYGSVDAWNNYDPLLSVITTGSGTSVNFDFGGIDPGDYLLDVWKDTDNSGDWSVDDFIGIWGDIETLDLYWITIGEGETLDFDIDMYLLVGDEKQKLGNHEKKLIKR